MLNVLALTYYFPRISETFVLDQLLFIDKKCNLTIYSLFNPAEKKATEDLVLEKEQHYEVKNLSSRIFYESNVSRFSTLKELLRNDFNLLHFQFGELYAGVEKFIVDRKSLLTLHTISNLDRLLKSSRLENHNILLLPTSCYLTEKCRSLLSNLGNRSILTHYLGIDIAKYSPDRTVGREPAEPRFNVVLNGRLVGKKGHLTALKAFRTVADEIPYARLLFIGDGLLRNKIEEEIVGLDLVGKVVLTGKLERNKVIDLYKRADVGIQPSEKYDGNEEGLPTSTMEYLAMQLAVVATNHAGIPEIVRHNETGFLIEEKDADSLARCLILLAKNKQVSCNLGVAGRDLMLRDFNLGRQNSELMDIYEQFVKT